MIDLSSKTVLVVGGTGEVGEGIVRQFLSAGATVIVPSRSQKRLDDLRALVGSENSEKLKTFVAEVGTVEGAAALRDRIAESGLKVNHVVASLGGWWQGQPLTEVSLELWHKLIDDSLTAHFIAAKTFLPQLLSQADSSYTFINGAGGMHAVPTAGPISVSAAAQMMLQRVFAAENQKAPTRINTLVLATPVITRSRPQGQAGWINADDAGKYSVYLASGAAHDVRGETIIFDSASKLPTA